MFLCLASTASHTRRHTLPTAVVSGCQGDRVTTATPGHLRGRGPAPRLHAVREMQQPVVALETASASAERREVRIAAPWNE